MLSMSQCAAARPPQALHLRLLQALLPRKPRIGQIDIEGLPDNLLRDLGLADGRGLPLRDPRRD